MDRDTIFSTLSQVGSNVRLQEGIYGLIKFLAVIDRYPHSSMINISKESGFPIPICVAIRNELVKIKWCSKESKGTSVTELGSKALFELGRFNKSFSCSNCENGLTFPIENYKEIIEKLRALTDLRGPPNTVIDQSFATTETSLVRVLTMGDNYDLFFRNYAFVGDSDLTSIALALLIGSKSRITVFDIDTRIRDIIEKANEEHNFDIIFVEHDLRTSIPEEYRNKYDCFVTDPPYTIDGLNLFISRGIELINNSTGGVGYLSFGNKPPNDQLLMQKNLSKMRCLITHIFARFNEYIGAQKLGGVSNFYRMQILSEAKPIIDNNYEGFLYTGERKPTKRLYQCKNCKIEIEVGQNQKFVTIEQLKEVGCPECKKYIFQKKRERKAE